MFTYKDLSTLLLEPHSFRKDSFCVFGPFLTVCIFILLHPLRKGSDFCLPLHPFINVEYSICSSIKRIKYFLRIFSYCFSGYQVFLILYNYFQKSVPLCLSKFVYFIHSRYNFKNFSSQKILK